MANPSPDAVAKIRSFVPAWTAANDAVLAALNAPALANPASQAIMPKPFTVMQVFGLIGSGSIAKLNAVPYLPDIRDKIQANDLAGCALYVSLLAGGGVIQPSEAAAVLAVVQATEPDPAYAPQISWAQANLGRPADLLDVIAARPIGD